MSLFCIQAFASYELGSGTRSTTSLQLSPLHSPRLANDFTSFCTSQGLENNLCRQMTSPNSASTNTFYNVYPRANPFILMPNRSTWSKGVQLLSVAQSMSKFGKICEIRNWYRPEPYNSAVGGVGSSRHLDGSAIDIEFCSVTEKNKALQAALSMRRRFGTPPGVGVYGRESKVIHIDLTNRIYGPGIVSFDRSVSRTGIYKAVTRPTLRPTAVSRPSRPKDRRTGGFIRDIINFFTGKG